LVNNAAIHGWINKKAVVDTTEEVWDRTLNINLTAPYLLCKETVPHMIRRGGGSIVNIASIGGLEAFREFAAYSTSKGGLVLLTKCLALDYGKYQIRANAICPGAIETPGSQAFMTEREAYMKTIAAITPLERTGSPNDIAMAALYLGSDESSYVTGTMLVVDGGRMAMA
jgi:NAD(P)-dependent dehydrogenase (short-subunit alcohol dehydrogenase family)